MAVMPHLRSVDRDDHVARLEAALRHRADVHAVGPVEVLDVRGQPLERRLRQRIGKAEHVFAPLLVDDVPVRRLRDPGRGRVRLVALAAGREPVVEVDEHRLVLPGRDLLRGVLRPRIVVRKRRAAGAVLLVLLVVLVEPDREPPRSGFCQGRSAA